jgi:hypothetical protein
MPWSEVKKNRAHFHAHEVTWCSTKEQKGFTHLPQQMREAPAFQFKAFDICRLFGFFDAENIFQVVWIDRGHQIYGSR